MKLPIKRALLSVSDKQGLVPLAEVLVANGVEIVSSGGTADHLEQAGIQVARIADVTGAPEMLGGRVKTLHPVIHGAILANHGDPSHREDLLEREIDPIQLVVVNLYPFESTIARGAEHAAAIEKIDIGGPTLIRAAAKNHAWVAVVVSPDRYPDIVDAVSGGGTDADLRLELAKEAFFRTAQYDAAIVNWFERDGADRLVLPMLKRSELRYGENPQQAAAVYSMETNEGWWASADQIQGKQMSFNNYADADAAWRLVNDLPSPSVAILKHMNACGVATGATVTEAFDKAWEGDPLSAFGGVVACNAPVDEATAEALSSRFVEIVIAPGVSDEARVVLSTKKNLRVLIATPPSAFDLDVRTIDDGFLIQKRDSEVTGYASWEPKTRIAAPVEQTDLEMAWIICAHTKSNAIVLVRDGAAVGVGAGDQSRVGAAERALVKAGDRAVGAVCASDAFFPFRDGPDALAAAGVTAIVEPGGSVRDHEIVEAAREHDVALFFTGQRHFRH